MDESKKFTIYIAGPMRGHKWYNYPAFGRAAQMLRDLGHEVISPAELDIQAGFNVWEMDEDSDWTVFPASLKPSDIIERDLNAIISKCDGMFMLNGWTQSTGANLEHGLAKFLGLHIEYESAAPIDVEPVEELVEPLDPPHLEVLTNEGIKHDDHKLRWDLLPWEVIQEVVKVLTYGAKKYDDNNWRKGMRWGRLFAAGMRHRVAFNHREQLDKETGIHHLAHAICEDMFLMASDMHGYGKDDRLELN